MLNREQNYRRLEFMSGTAIRLADGQNWTFRAPTAGGVSPYRSDYESIVKALLEAEDEADFLQAEFVLVVYLLDRNYELSPTILQDLLDFSGEPAALEKMRGSFRSVTLDHMQAFRLRPGPDPVAAKSGRLRLGFWNQIVASRGV